MKKRKFSLFFLAAILLTLSFLCGCSNQSAEAEFNTFQAQEEILTTEQTKKEVKKDTTDVDQVKKEDVTVSGEKKDDKVKLTDEKLTEDKKAQEETTKKAEEEAKAKAEAEAKAKAEAEAEAKKKAEEEKKAQEPTAPTSSEKSCTILISCDTILSNMDQCDTAKISIVPTDGVILSATTVSFSEGETVFDVLQRTCRNKGISLEFSYTPLYGSYYIEGISNLYEFDVGPESGWMYKVNGWFPNYGCSEYTLEDGDSISWVYTCNGLGADVGGGYAAGG